MLGALAEAVVLNRDQKLEVEGGKNSPKNTRSSNEKIIKEQEMNASSVFCLFFQQQNLYFY